jgi:hypothetical protein
VATASGSGDAQPPKDKAEQALERGVLKFIDELAEVAPHERKRVHHLRPHGRTLADSIQSALQALLLLE